MNRYVQAVAEMDRRWARTVRVLSVAGVTALVIVAFWSAGLPSALWSALQSRHTPDVQAQVVTPAPTVSAVSTARVLPSDPTASGGASSLAKTPQPLLLIATTPGKDQREGTARIGTSAEAPQTYVAGAVLVNGARLTQIHVDLYPASMG